MQYGAGDKPWHIPMRSRHHGASASIGARSARSRRLFMFVNRLHEASAELARMRHDTKESADEADEERRARADRDESRNPQ